MGFGVISFLAALNRRSLASAGLRPTTVDIDGGATTMHCWVPTSLLTSPKPPLVLIHGFGPEATWQWKRQISPLSRHFSLIIPDLVFFGGSTTRSPDRSESFQADCVARLLDALGVTSPIAAVVGTSYGGFVAYHLARNLGPERVGKVIIASSDVLKREGDDAALRERAEVDSVSDVLIPRTPEQIRTLIRLCVHQQPRFMPEFLLRDALHSMYSEKLDEKMELMKGIRLHEVQVKPLPQDVLIIWGEHDGLFPLDKAHALKKELGEKARLEIMEGTSHLPQLENPAVFNKLLLDFLLDNGSNPEHSTKA